MSCQIYTPQIVFRIDGPEDTFPTPNYTILVHTNTRFWFLVTAFNLATGYGPTSYPYDFFATGGGFSNYFTPPSYQAKAVADYLSEDLPFQSLPYYEVNADVTNIGQNGGVYNRLGRGYPDVSANGAFLLVYNNLTLFTFFGTSLSSPIFGAVITLINEERTVVGKGPIGFINPALYESKCFLLNTFDAIVLMSV
jgi:tripeptidyl-peptidase-1